MANNLFLVKNQDRIEKRYALRCEKMPAVFAEISRELERIEATLKVHVQADSVKIAMKYLYGYMPYSDIGNYDFFVFLDYAVSAVSLWEEYDRVKKLPEDIFLNYILFHRVNEEEIAPCRGLFNCEMKKTGGILDVQIEDEKEIAREVNYWCSGEVTYHATDDRTLSARTVFLRGNGRCGEESVFVVNALRSAGIAARQVYAPRWSHCDDNHAWVEVYCNGKWYFMGACEAEPILNKGWFTNASSRAMMIHSRWFDGEHPQNEKVVGKDGIELLLNQLGRYAKTVEVQVLVTDQEGKALEGVAVQFEILNYAEYVPIAVTETDKEGKTGLITGFGSICVSVQYEDNYIYQWIDTRSRTRCHLVVHPYAQETGWTEYDFTAPLDSPVNADMPTLQQKECSDKRLKALSEKCSDKMKTWENEGLGKFLAADYGNKELQKKLVSCLSEKDLTDCKAEVLEEHLKEASRYDGMYPDTVFVSALLNPRIGDEVMTAYRRSLCMAFDETTKKEYCKSPEKIWWDIENTIAQEPAQERASVITVPCALMKLKTGSFLSKKILFVAICRSLGIPARLNPADGRMEYWNDGTFASILPDQNRDCTLTVTGESDDTQEWSYTRDWTIAQWTAEGYKTLLLEQVPWEGGNLTLDLESGLYRIITVNRLPNGNIFEAEKKILLSHGDVTKVVLKKRKANLSDMLENIKFQDFALKNDADEDIFMSELSEGRRKVFIWLEESREPTEHILNEIFEMEKVFQKHADALNFIVRTKEAVKQPTLERTLRTIQGIDIYYDDFQENINILGRRMYVDFEKLPFVLITDGSLNGIYAATGYNVGMADMIMKILG